MEKQDWMQRCHTGCEHASGAICLLCRRTYRKLFELCASCPTPCPKRSKVQELVAAAAQAHGARPAPELPEKIYRDNGHENVIPIFRAKRKPPTLPGESS